VVARFHICLFLVLSAQAADLRMLVPLYSYPNWYDPPNYIWDDIAAAATNIPITAIINPNDGPNGGPPNGDYVVGLDTLRSNGVTMLGYVYTSYGVRPLTNVFPDVDLYDQHFDIDGIFVDEAASGTNQLDYYQALYDYIKSRTNLHAATVVINPGTTADEGYLTRPACDTAVIFENDTGWPGYTTDTYVANYPSARFAALFYDAPNAGAMRTNIDLAVQRNITFVYSTDDNGDNPWDELPTYWLDEVNYVREINQFHVTRLAVSNSDIVVSHTTVTTKTTRVERSDTLVNWSPLTNNIDPGGALLGRRFYRAVAQ
jgi:hypothetical protein